MRDDIYVEVRDPDSDPSLAPRPASGTLATRIDELGTAITATVAQLCGHFDRDLPEVETEQWRADGVEVSFRLDLLPDSGVVLVRTDARNAVSVKVMYKRRPAT
ncbi:MAG TPA: hypothetical protein VF069_08215 [Streptosporangiaceae bacterium]